MCGIAGILATAPGPFDDVLASMAAALAHRGPDAQGVWSDAAAGIGLAHRRLSILDLSPQGAQPMVSAGGRYVLSYNGEVYNHATLRAELERDGPLAWRGHSDTEVLLAAIERFGVAATLAKANGMFAFAVWDREARELVLARDRLGEKPLYIGRIGAVIAFASELKALRRLPGFRQDVDREALGLLLRFGQVPAPWSIHPGIFKLPAGCVLRLRAGAADFPRDVHSFAAAVDRYWDLAAVARAGLADPFRGDPEEAVDVLEALLADAVRMRMEADVPIGALLSGGVDSSLVAALMQKASSRPVRTFTVGFDEARYDEAPHAGRIAEFLGTAHTAIELSPDAALEIIPRLPELYDEPFADASQVPTAAICAVARRHVTVALSGDGGDEFFFGYQRYFDATRIWDRLGVWPYAARRTFAACLRAGGALGTPLSAAAYRLWRQGRRIDARDFRDYYGRLLSLALEPTASHWPAGIPAAPCGPGDDPALAAPWQAMRYFDQSFYLPDDILTKTDRASMAVGLELRVPLLDPSVVAFSWRLPPALLGDGRQGKLLLKALLYRHVPRELVERPKQGFEIPLAAWLRGPLREWASALLAPSALAGSDLLDAAALSRLYAEHLAGRADHAYALWPALVFETWRRHHGAAR